MSEILTKQIESNIKTIEVYIQWFNNVIKSLNEFQNKIEKNESNI